MTNLTRHKHPGVDSREGLGESCVQGSRPWRVIEQRYLQLARRDALYDAYNLVAAETEWAYASAISAHVIVSLLIERLIKFCSPAEVVELRIEQTIRSQGG